MMPELEMDWIAEVTSERLYGPTTLGAIREFLRVGEIDHDTYVINTRDASRQRMSEIAPFFEPAPSEEESLWNGHDPDFSGPAAAGMSIAIHDRIRELEQALREERRATAEAEDRYRALELRHHELMSATGRPPS